MTFCQQLQPYMYYPTLAQRLLVIWDNIDKEGKKPIISFLKIEWSDLYDTMHNIFIYGIIPFGPKTGLALAMPCHKI